MLNDRDKRVKKTGFQVVMGNQTGRCMTILAFFAAAVKTFFSSFMLLGINNVCPRPRKRGIVRGHDKNTILLRDDFNVLLGAEHVR